jgi:hypothetical protein
LNRYAQKDSKEIYFVFLGALYNLLRFKKNVTIFWDYLNQNEFHKSKLGYRVAGPKLAQGFGLLANGRKASQAWLRWPGPAATRPKQAWLCRRGVNAPAAVTVCGASAVAWLPAEARPERRGEVWRWGTSGEGRRRRGRWFGRELTRGAARRGGGGGAAVRRRSTRPTVAGTVASRAELGTWLADVVEASSTQASTDGTARMAPGGKAQRHSSRHGEAGGSGSTWLSSAVAQAEASSLEHGMRDVWPGRSQTKRILTLLSIHGTHFCGRISAGSRLSSRCA